MSADNPVILLVEGDIVARTLLAQYLRQHGLRIVEAASGEEAKVVLNSPKLKIRTVLANAAARGSGFPLQHWIRLKNPDVQVILAGSVDKMVERACSLCQAGPVPSKAYEHHLVRDEIQRAAARRDRALRDTGESNLD